MNDSEQEFVARLPKKRMGAGVLFRDAAGRVLLVEPSYKPTWEIPGGVVEEGESPWAAAQRELVEELGWHRPFGRLLVVDHVLAHDSRPDGIMFVFDGGVLTQSEVDNLVFPDGEILSARFLTVTEARERVQPFMADRLESAVQAVTLDVVTLCEHGRPVT